METGKNTPAEALTVNKNKPAIFGMREMKSHHDLISAGIAIHPNYVIDRWGPEAAIEYSKAVTARIADRARKSVKP